MTPRKADQSANDPPVLTDDDIRWIHEQRKLDAHAEWLRGQIRVIWPWLVAVVGALVGAVKLIKDHVKW